MPAAPRSNGLAAREALFPFQNSQHGRAAATPRHDTPQPLDPARATSRANGGPSPCIRVSSSPGLHG
jgi:hypothetical protein